MTVTIELVGLTVRKFDPPERVKKRLKCGDADYYTVKVPATFKIRGLLLPLAAPYQLIIAITVEQFTGAGGEKDWVLLSTAGTSGLVFYEKEARIGAKGKDKIFRYQSTVFVLPESSKYAVVFAV